MKYEEGKVDENLCMAEKWRCYSLYLVWQKLDTQMHDLASQLLIPTGTVSVYFFFRQYILLFYSPNSIIRSECVWTYA